MKNLNHSPYTPQRIESGVLFHSREQLQAVVLDERRQYKLRKVVAHVMNSFNAGGQPPELTKVTPPARLNNPEFTISLARMVTREYGFGGIVTVDTKVASCSQEAIEAADNSVRLHGRNSMVGVFLHNPFDLNDTELYGRFSQVCSTLGELCLPTALIYVSSQNLEIESAHEPRPTMSATSPVAVAV